MCLKQLMQMNVMKFPQPTKMYPPDEAGYTDQWSQNYLLNEEHNNEVFKFSAHISSESNHAKKVPDLLDAAHLLIIPLRLHGVTIYFDVYLPSIADYQYKIKPKIQLTAEEPCWDPSAEASIVDH